MREDHNKGSGTLVLVFAVAAAAQLAAVWWFAARPLGGDEVEYDALARGLVETGRYTRQAGFSSLMYSAEAGAFTSFRPPGWPWVLAGFYRLFGYSLLPPRLGLALWNAAGCVVLTLLAERVFSNRRVGVAAGLLWALWPAAIWYPGTRSLTLGSESLSLPLLLLALLLLARAPEGRPWLAVLAGVLLGACALVRSNFVLLLPLGAAWAIAAARGGIRPRLHRATLVLVGGLLVVFPWMLRNHARLGSFVIATQLEPLFLGNNAWASGSYDSEFFDHFGSLQVRWLVERHPGFRAKTELEKGRIYAGEALVYAREHPRREAWLVGRRALFFFSPLREAEDGDISYDWAFATVVGVCLLGLRFLRPRGVGVWVLALPVVATFITCIVVLFMPRYRYPAEPTLVALACQTVNVAGARFGWRAALWAVALVLAFNFGVALFLG
jgi:4-amino-4-deoxy-L-arabinose transferase-like glycosyltransferase